MKNNTYKPLTKAELTLIKEKKPNETFRVLLTTSEADTKVLKAKSVDIDPKDPAIKLLADRMYATVQDEASKELELLLHKSVSIVMPFGCSVLTKMANLLSLLLIQKSRGIRILYVMDAKVVYLFQIFSEKYIEA